MNIKKLAALVNATVEGDDTIEIVRMSGAETAEPGDLTFAIDEAYLTAAEKSSASAILTVMGMRRSPKPLIRVKDPKLAFLILYNTLAAAGTHTAFVHPSASVDASARIGKNVWIGPHVAIAEKVVIDDDVTIVSNASIQGHCRIGKGCHIHPNVTLYAHTTLGKNVILHSGIVVGSDGFGYIKEAGAILKFPQLGRVIIEDNVEIGANTTIDRGSLSNTVIGAGTKIDNLCQIAHNVKIGKNVLMAAQCGISGSTTIEDNVTIGGQVGVADNITIGANTLVAAKSGIIGSIEKDAVVWGIPARPIAQTKRQMASLTWLAKNMRRLSQHLKE